MTNEDKFDTIFNDDPKDITLGRHVARYLSKYNWYSPERGGGDDEDFVEEVTSIDNQVPKLDEAWANFEHIGLPRAFITRNTDLGTYDRAEPGEKHPTKLYPVWGTSIKDMGDFGVGVGLYFTTLRYYAIMAFIAGLINIPALMYFSSDDYSPTDRQDLPELVMVSAACTEAEWRPCPSCTESDWNRFPNFATDRFGVGKASDGSELTFIRVNDCRPDQSLGITTFISMLFVIAAVYLINYLQEREAVKFDEAEQTSTDYSINITNPPREAKDPDSWKDFFESQFEVKVNVCTIALNNQELINALIDRRKSLRALDNLLPRAEDIDEDNLTEALSICWSVPLWKRIICFAKTPKAIVKDINEKESEIVDKIKALREESKVTSVFVTFDTEKSQRKVLKKLSVARFQEKNMESDKMYQGTVLRVVEPDEPVSIRWLDLDDSFMRQNVLKFITLIISFGLIIASGFVIAGAQTISNLVTAVVIVLVSVVTPVIVGILVAFESHSSETAKTASKYLKVTVFRWVTTVIIPLVITPFTNTLDSEAVLRRVGALFIAELVRGPILQTLDIIGTIFRHFIGPRAEDQRRMNVCFSGSRYDIGDQYTDVSKILFLTLFYSVVYPVGFFFASAIFIVYYWVDKYSILRVYRQGPRVGPRVSRLSAFFFKLCILAYAIMLSFLYSSFPYDNACLSNLENEDLSAYTGSIDITSIDGEEDEIQITTPLEGYMYCNQELIRYMTLPALPSLQKESGGTWMTKEQEEFSKIFGWASVAVLVLVLGTTVYYFIQIYVLQFFFKPYQKFKYEPSEEKFDDVMEISAYIPQVQVSGFTFPFLLCETTNILEKHMGWTDPRGDGYEKHNLINDVQKIFERQEEVHHSDEPIFDIVKVYT